MVKHGGILILTCVVLAVGLSNRVFAQPASPAASSTESASPGVRAATVIVVHGKIVAIDKAKKSVTLEGPEGRQVALKVNNPHNLEAVKVGDPVVARFTEIVTIRKKKPGENLPSASVSGGIVTAKPGEPPGAAAAQQLTVVFGVVDVDRAQGLVTIKGPDGSVETVKAQNPKNLDQLKSGDELVVTSTKAAAISVEKES